MSKKVLTLNEVAREYGYSYPWLLATCKTDKTFPCHKVGAHFRIPRDLLDEWIREQCKR